MKGLLYFKVERVSERLKMSCNTLQRYQKFQGDNAQTKKKNRIKLLAPCIKTSRLSLGRIYQEAATLSLATIVFSEGNRRHCCTFIQQYSLILFFQWETRSTRGQVFIRQQKQLSDKFFRNMDFRQQQIQTFQKAPRFVIHLADAKPFTVNQFARIVLKHNMWPALNNESTIKQFQTGREGSSQRFLQLLRGSRCSRCSRRKTRVSNTKYKVRA